MVRLNQWQPDKQPRNPPARGKGLAANAFDAEGSWCMEHSEAREMWETLHAFLDTDLTNLSHNQTPPLGSLRLSISGGVLKEACDVIPNAHSETHWFFVMDWVGESRPTGNTRIRRLWYEFSGNEQAKVNQRGGKAEWSRIRTDDFDSCTSKNTTTSAGCESMASRQQKSPQKRPTGARPAIFSNLKEWGL